MTAYTTKDHKIERSASLRVFLIRLYGMLEQVVGYVHSDINGDSEPLTPVPKTRDHAYQVTRLNGVGQVRN